MKLTTEQQGSMIFHILDNNYHLPLVEGKANLAKIENEIIIGLYKGEIPPIDQEDIDIISTLIDGLVDEYGEPNEGKVQ